jgi:hypothetical protein
MAPTTKLTGEFGVTVIDDNTITVKVTGGLIMLFIVAVMFVVPADMPITFPDESVTPMTGEELVHVTREVMSAVDLSEYVPSAVNGSTWFTTK